ncbi:3'-5' exonuclease [Histidinibacterium lentulum]|uniref:DNA-directed DNA polymerase n=1 Tax=Histidinibacterium lentulum TaxID=2480588 RepID=A0A3N2QS58_9RHOB|nr:exonuclease domain-containing protein [Histidinibacterium lentulum]ROT98051.1 exonuclease [Histidinibacterium lentulum]
MGERLGLRIRFALFFAALAIGGVAIFAGGLLLGQARASGPVDGYVIAGLVGGFGLMGLAAWIGLLFDANVARPILGLAADLHTRAQTDVPVGIEAHDARYLGALAPAAQAIHEALEEARTSQERAVAEKTARMARDTALFEALLRDLSEGVVVVSPDLRIRLYNRVATDLLGPLGLDRPLSAFLRLDPVSESIARCAAHSARGQPRTETFLAATHDGERLLVGSVCPVVMAEARVGHVLTFHDATEELRTHGALEHLLAETVESARRPTAAIGAMLDVLAEGDDLPAADRDRMNAAMRDELKRLFAVLNGPAAADVATARPWPIAEVAVSDIFDALEARLMVPFEVTPSDAVLSCDGYAITELLSRVVQETGGREGVRSLRLSAEPAGREISLVLSWAGAPISQGALEQWVKAPLSPAYGGYSGRDALSAHRTEIWTETGAEGARIVLPLAAAHRPEPPAAPAIHRDFYAFDLPAFSGPLGERALSEAAFVVFDTETTGLDPARDEIVQIAGVRLLGGRLLRGETFDTLVDPGRPIPPSSTKIHGIDDARVRGAPGVAEAGRAFARFAEGSVLVAHHASFDMALLEAKADLIGWRPETPALCTGLLSAALYPHASDHTLDALAARFGVAIDEKLRHTALGDALATAEVFLRMVPVLEAAGVTTLAHLADVQRQGLRQPA